MNDSIYEYFSVQLISGFESTPYFVICPNETLNTTYLGIPPPLCLQQNFDTSLEGLYGSNYADGIVYWITSCEDSYLQWLFPD